MSYKAVFTDEFLSYFRLDDNGKTLVLTDRQGFTRAVPLEVEIEPKHGKWISVPNKKNRICSICEGDEPYKFADEDVNIFDYCPYCGAKMDDLGAKMDGEE